MNCSEQQPERQYEESPTATAQPDLFYAQIAPSQEPDLGNNHAYANATEMNNPKVNDPELLSKNNDIVYGDIAQSQDPVSGNDNLEDNDTVMYSELLSREQC